MDPNTLVSWQYDGENHSFRTEPLHALPFNYKDYDYIIDTSDPDLSEIIITEHVKRKSTMSSRKRRAELLDELEGFDRNVILNPKNSEVDMDRGEKAIVNDFVLPGVGKAPIVRRSTKGRGTGNVNIQAYAFKKGSVPAHIRDKALNARRDRAEIVEKATVVGEAAKINFIRLHGYRYNGRRMRNGQNSYQVLLSKIKALNLSYYVNLAGESYRRNRGKSEKTIARERGIKYVDKGTRPAAEAKKKPRKGSGVTKNKYGGSKPLVKATIAPSKPKKKSSYVRKYTDAELKELRKGWLAKGRATAAANRGKK